MTILWPIADPYASATMSVPDNLIRQVYQLQNLNDIRPNSHTCQTIIRQDLRKMKSIVKTIDLDQQVLVLFSMISEVD